MIPVNDIKTIIAALAVDLDLTIIRSDQPGKHPAYPYASYKVTSEFTQAAHQDIRSVGENAVDGTSVDNFSNELNQATISFTFLDKSRVDRISVFATNAIRYFKSIAGRELAKTKNITMMLLGTGIDDRTVFQEAFHENRLGFDVRFDQFALITETIEGITTLEIGVTIDGEVQDDIVITP